MRHFTVLLAVVASLSLSVSALGATNLLTNGNLDQTYAQEIVPGFFLPKPQVWVNEGTRTITGAYEDELSSEPWAGPAPTPVTTDASGLPSPDGVGEDNLDAAVFFKAFTGNTTNGAMTGHLYQDVAGTPGVKYTLTGWAGAEANLLASQAVFAIDFLDAGNLLIGSAELDLYAAGLFTDNGEPFDYKQYSVMATAPAGTATVRARVSLIGGQPNPAGGGQAFVVDDFELTDDTVTGVPTPSALAGAALLTAIGAIRRRRSRA